MKNDYFLGLSEEGFHRVVYSEWGSRSEILPIICAHGLTRNRHDFDDLANYLSNQGEHVFCPDIVGRGDSGWFKNPLHYTYEQYIADMNVMIARTQAQSINWIGTSMGGLLGMVLASMQNSPIKKLVINDIGPQIPAKGIARLAKHTGNDPEFANLEEAKNYYKTIYFGFGNLTDEQWLKIAKNGVREVSPGRFVTKIDPGIKIAPAKSKIAWQALLHPLKVLEGSFFDVDLWQVWYKISCPVLVIHGQTSDLLLPAIIQKMQQTHKQVEVIEVSNSGHAPALLDPILHGTIYQWLKK